MRKDLLGVLTGLALTAAASAQVKPMAPHPRVAPESYTAEFKITHVRTLANGTTITRESSRVQARDSQGRQIWINTSAQEYGNHGTNTSAHIDDPVAGTRIDWNSQKKVVTVVELPLEDQRHGCWRAEGGHTMHYPADRTTRLATPPADPAATIPANAIKEPPPVFEDLGDAVILGVEAHGQRTTRTTPAGEIGNDQPLVHTTETWTAKGGLGLQLRYLADDPQNGKEDQELVNLTRGEPDAALFQFPDGYEVVNVEMVPCRE